LIVTYMRSTSEITGLGGALENEALVEPSRIELCVFSWNAESGARCLSSSTSQSASGFGVHPDHIPQAKKMRKRCCAWVGQALLRRFTINMEVTWRWAEKEKGRRKEKGKRERKLDLLPMERRMDSVFASARSVDTFQSLSSSIFFHALFPADQRREARREDLRLARF
jgi:hypothetical protein